MVAILDTLRKDHVNLRRLLRVFAMQGAVFERADPPDYDLIEDILDYCENFPDRYHHPLENVILKYLRQRDAASATQVGDIENEHKSIAERARSLRARFRHVREEEEISRDAVLNEIRSFLDSYHQHMNMEEQVLFHAAAAGLRTEDWQAVESECVHIPDPLSGGPAEVRYGRLRREILRDYEFAEDR